MFKPTLRPAGILLALGLLVIAGVGGNPTNAYAQSPPDPNIIRLDSCSETYEQIEQYKDLNVTCDYQVNGRHAAVTLESDLKNPGHNPSPHWTALVWVLEDSDTPTTEKEARQYNSTQSKEESPDVHVDGEKILKVQIKGQVPRAYHHADPHKDPLGHEYRHETPRPTEFDILRVSLGKAASTVTAQPVTATSVAEEWREVSSLYDEFTAEANTPEEMVAETGRKLLDEGYIDIAKTLLETAQDVQAGNPENRGKSKIGWYIGGGISALIVSVAIVVVFVIAMANRDNGDTGPRRHNTVNSPPGGPNRPAGAPPRR